MSDVKVKEAVELFGMSVVNDVMSMVEISDADGVWATCQDMGMDTHVECIELIYF